MLSRYFATGQKDDRPGAGVSSGASIFRARDWSKGSDSNAGQRPAAATVLLLGMRSCERVVGSDYLRCTHVLRISVLAMEEWKWRSTFRKPRCQIQMGKWLRVTE